jgi:hypothetical protein
VIPNFDLHDYRLARTESAKHPGASIPNSGATVAYAKKWRQGGICRGYIIGIRTVPKLSDEVTANDPSSANKVKIDPPVNCIVEYSRVIAKIDRALTPTLA